MKRNALLFLLPLVLLGCFDVNFEAKTIVHPDGSVFRETKIDGRGVDLLKEPQGESWKIKRWKTQGGQTLLRNTYHHLFAEGRFQPNQDISSDFEFDFETQSQSWGEEDQAKLEQAGVREPYSSHLYSKNTIHIKRTQGFFAHTYSYEEVFENKGIVELLLLDLQAEIENEPYGEVGPKSEEEVRALTLKRLKKSILPFLQFRHELYMPGEIVSSNATAKENGHLIWDFSMSDFEQDFSQVTLTAVSRSLRLTGIVLGIVSVILTVFLIVFILAGIRKIQKKRRS